MSPLAAAFVDLGVFFFFALSGEVSARAGPEGGGEGGRRSGGWTRKEGTHSVFFFFVDDDVETQQSKWSD